MTFPGRYLWYNLDLKLASLAIAMLLWAAVSREPVSEVGYDIPLHLRNAPASLELSSETPTTVEVRLRGRGSALQRVSPANLAVSVDLAGFRAPGERSFPLVPADLALPMGVEVVRVVPSQVSVKLEERTERPVPVRLRLVGNLPSGYWIARSEVLPQMVTVVGPRSRVEGVREVWTDPIDISGKIARATFRAGVSVPDPFLRVASRPQVRVTLYVERGPAPPSTGSGQATQPQPVPRGVEGTPGL